MKRTLAVIPATLAMLFVASPALAQDAAAATASARGTIALAAALAIGIAAAGGAIGQGMAARAGLEGVARNPQAADKIRANMILGLALIESLVIYALVIAFILSIIYK